MHEFYDASGRMCGFCRILDVHAEGEVHASCLVCTAPTCGDRSRLPNSTDEICAQLLQIFCQAGSLFACALKLDPLRITFGCREQVFSLGLVCYV